MGQKINPIAYRLGVNIDWPSRWAASKKKQYQEFLLEDAKIRRFLEKRLSLAGLIAVNIERSFNKMKLTLQTSRPGVVIGRGGKSLEALKKELCQIVSVEEPEKNLEIRIEEVERPELSALFVAQKIADQLKRRLPYRQVVQKEMERVREAEGLLRRYQEIDCLPQCHELLPTTAGCKMQGGKCLLFALRDDVNSFLREEVVDMTGMFMNCTKLPPKPLLSVSKRGGKDA